MNPLPDAFFKHALDCAQDIVMIMQADFSDVGGSTIVYANPAFTEALEYSAEDVLGQNPRMLQGENTDKMTRMEIRVSLKQKKSIRSKILNYTKSGKPVLLDANIVPITDEKGDVTHFLAIERIIDEAE